LKNLAKVEQLRLLTRRVANGRDWNHFETLVRREVASAKSRSYHYEPDIEKARVLLPSTPDQFMAVCLIAANLENVLQLLVCERMQVWPYLVVLVVAFILFQPLCNRIVGMHRDA
jgi:hypothetical protein